MGANTGFNQPVGISFDMTFPFNLIVANSGGNNLNTYGTPLASGDPSPASTITNGVFGPNGIEDVLVNGEELILVADSNGTSVTIYNVDGVLVSTINGLNTGLNNPRGVVLIPSP
jgi:hypothetical protein